jgi:hypothetical protein
MSDAKTPPLSEIVSRLRPVILHSREGFQLGAVAPKTLRLKARQPVNPNDLVVQEIAWHPRGYAVRLDSPKVEGKLIVIDSSKVDHATVE